MVTTDKGQHLIFPGKGKGIGRKEKGRQSQPEIISWNNWKRMPTYKKNHHHE